MNYTSRMSKTWVWRCHAKAHACDPVP